MKGFMYGSIASNILLAGSLSMLLGMVNSLQLIIHLPIMNFPIPANAMTLIRYLVPIVMFDLLDQDFIWDYLPV